METLFDEVQLCDYLKVSKRTVQGWRFRGGGPVYIRVGRLVRYRESDVKAWLESQKRRHSSDPGPGQDEAA